MRKYIFIAFSFLLCFYGYGQHKNKNVYQKETFNQELIKLKHYFNIPGLSVLIKHDKEIIYEDYLGIADQKKQISVDNSITFPIASLTKIFSGIIILQLVEEGKLSLDDPINAYTPSYKLSDAIKIKHVLSHTSQGEVGEHFYYSTRFGLLTSVIEKCDDQSFEDAVKQRILKKLKLNNTYLLRDAAQLADEDRKIASPYFLGGEMKNGFLSKEIRDGFIDYGFSSAAGIVSTVSDLAKLDDAINENVLLAENTTSKMFSPFNENSPYGLGIFSQEFMDEKLVWGYGQYDCYSSLFLKVPGKGLTLILMANNNLMSDPARLINGDVTTSLFALSFLKNYVFDNIETPLFEDEVSLKRLSGDHSDFIRQKLIAQSLATAYMSRFDDEATSMSKYLLKKVFQLFPNTQNKADLNVLFNLQLLKFMDSMRKQQDFSDYDIYYKNIALSLFSDDDDNPYANYYMGNYYQMKSVKDSTAFYFKRLLKAENFSPWWYTKEAEDWLKENKE